jgi:hypothetical protein
LRAFLIDKEAWGLPCSSTLFLEQLVTLFVGALTGFAQLVVMLFKAGPNGFVVARTLEFFHLFFASFPIKLA